MCETNMSSIQSQILLINNYASLSYDYESVFRKVVVLIVLPTYSYLRVCSVGCACAQGV